MSGYLVVTSRYCIVQSRYLAVTSDYLPVTSGYFRLLLVTSGYVWILSRVMF